MYEWHKLSTCRPYSLVPTPRYNMVDLWSVITFALLTSSSSQVRFQIASSVQSRWCFEIDHVCTIAKNVQQVFGMCVYRGYYRISSLPPSSGFSFPSFFLSGLKAANCSSWVLSIQENEDALLSFSRWRFKPKNSLSLLKQEYHMSHPHPLHQLNLHQQPSCWCWCCCSCSSVSSSSSSTSSSTSSSRSTSTSTSSTSSSSSSSSWSSSSSSSNVVSAMLATLLFLLSLLNCLLPKQFRRLFFPQPSKQSSQISAQIPPLAPAHQGKARN